MIAPVWRCLKIIDCEIPDYLKALATIWSAGRGFQIVSDIHSITVDTVQAEVHLEEGYQLLVYRLGITMLATTCQNGLNPLREGDLPKLP